MSGGPSSLGTGQAASHTRPPPHPQATPCSGPSVSPSAAGGAGGVPATQSGQAYLGPWWRPPACSPRCGGTKISITANNRCRLWAEQTSPGLPVASRQASYGQLCFPGADVHCSVGAILVSPSNQSVTMVTGFHPGAPISPDLEGSMEPSLADGTNGTPGQKPSLPPPLIRQLRPRGSRTERVTHPGPPPCSRTTSCWHPGLSRSALCGLLCVCVR